MNRREFLTRSAVAVTAGTLSTRTSGAEAKRPNVVLIITDDQGYGDLGCHGNPHVKTPNLDRVYRESTRFTRFYVCPVCSPTRACLMTGRYNYRTGVVDTFLGRSMMFGDETTLAEILSSQGYATGIFGKWHLGDHYPMRPMDQGFQESLVHYGGGIEQPSDPPGSGYFNPILQRNGTENQYQGYCTDIFASGAVEFIRKQKDNPFFVYLATNAPHVPLEVDDALVAPYLAMGLDDATARVYAMITNVDDNLGRVMATLEELGLDGNTLLIFMTDNGAQMQTPRYGAGLRGMKGTVYEGGIRVPSFWRWPERLAKGRDVSSIAAHIDVMPTILDLCDVPVPAELSIDGTSQREAMEGGQSSADRSLYFQWHRGDVPERFRACAVVTQKFKLVDGCELYDLEADPGESDDVADKFPEIVASMRAGYETWFKDVTGTRNFKAPSIVVGSPHENPVVLTRQDWRGADGWGDGDNGYWDIDVVQGGRYEIVARFATPPVAASVSVSLGKATAKADLTAESASVRVELDVAAGSAVLRVQLDGEAPGGPKYVQVTRMA